MPALAPSGQIHVVPFDEPPLSPPLSPPLEFASHRPARDQRRIVLRLRDGEIVQVGIAPDPDRAIALARALIAKLDTLEGDWPRVGNRFIRPDAIVSVDVLEFG